MPLNGADLSSILNTYNMPANIHSWQHSATVPQTVTCFNDNVDIGSKTLHNLNLTSITNYIEQLREVQDGKSAVDLAGNIDSKAFQAPNGATDEDIYSLLNRSNILADFSYQDHYNVLENGQFVKYDVSIFNAADYSPEFFLTIAQTSEPVIVQFDSTYPTSIIESYLSTLQSADFVFVNASQLVGLTLTQREF